jgi:1-pyrroline-5-carboxylate dehydrogenase
VFSGNQAEIDQFVEQIEAGVIYINRAAGATTGAWPGVQSFCGWKRSGSAGKGGLGHWYLQGFMREQSRTIAKNPS